MVLSHNTLGHKVEMEEMISIAHAAGLLAAVELYLKRDHAAQRREREAMLRRVADRLRGAPTLFTEFIPNLDPSHAPRLSVQWDEARLGLPLQQMITRLREGEPAIVAADMTRFRPPWKGLGIFANQLRRGEEILVADRVKQILTGKA